MSVHRSPSTSPRIGIIGAGLAGACAAWALSKRGARITVFERDHIASGASGAAAGMLQPLPGMRLTYREENIRDFYFSRQLIDAMLTAGETWRPLGVLRLVRHPKQEAQWHRRMQTIPAELAQWKDADALRAIEPRLNKDICAGVFLPDACMVDVPAFIHALLNAADATVFEGARAEAIENTPKGLSLYIEGESAPQVFDHIVIASGAQAPHPIEDSAIHMRPYMGIMATFEGFEPPPVALNYRGYITGWGHDSVLVGTVDRRSGFSEEPAPQTIEELKERLHSVLDTSGAPTLTNVWKGVRPAMPDHTPRAQRASAFERVWIFTGFGGRGLMVGPRLAESLAKAVFEEA